MAVMSLKLVRNVSFGPMEVLSQAAASPTHARRARELTSDSCHVIEWSYGMQHHGSECHQHGDRGGNFAEAGDCADSQRH